MVENVDYLYVASASGSDGRRNVNQHFVGLHAWRCIWIRSSLESEGEWTTKMSRSDQIRNLSHVRSNKTLFSTNTNVYENQSTVADKHENIKIWKQEMLMILKLECKFLSSDINKFLKI